MLKMIKQKKGSLFGWEELIFIFFTLAVFFMLILFVRGASQLDFIVEEKMAKEIALVINQASVGSSAKFDVSELYRRAEKNDFKTEKFVVIRDNNVNVQVSGFAGYYYPYFRNFAIEDAISKEIDEKGKERVYLNLYFAEEKGGVEDG